MKENILNRIQKYYTGGTPDTGKGFSLAMKGLRPLFTGAMSRSLGPLSLMLGANKLNANEYNSSSNPITGPSGNIMDNIMTALPEGSPEVNVDSVNTELGNIMNPYKRQMGGVEPLPGGVMAPIPGSDAVEFVGNKHDESGMGSDSGIMVDQNTEVEGGETMDEVVMNKGGARDYFFSDHLKKGGMSYAQHHKNILQNGGGQQEVNMLAKMQEKAANRDPKQVAKLGGVVKYQRAGVKVNMEDIMKLDPTYHQGILDIQNYTENQEREAKELKESQERIDRNFAEGNYLYDDEDVNFVDSQTGEVVANPGLSYPGGAGFAAGEMYPVARDQRPFDASLYNVPEETEDEKNARLAKADTFINAGYDEKELGNYYTAESLAKEEARKKMLEDLRGGLNKGAMPLEAKIMLGAQLLPALGAAFTKQKDPKKFSYTPGFTSPIVAGRVKGLKYEAPTQDEARSRLASAYTGQQKFLDTSGGGSTNFANRQALFAKKLQAEGTLGAQESKDRLSAENLSKQSQQQAEVMNVQNELKASSINAQMIQKEADRRQAIDNANAQLSNMRDNEKIQNRMSILNNFAQGVSVGMGDLMQYKSSDRLARATGIYGIYERDKIKNMLLKNPAFQNMNEEDRNKEIAKLYNQLTA